MVNVDGDDNITACAIASNKKRFLKKRLILTNYQ